MSRVKGKHTKPELIVRRAAHRLGLRFRLHRKDLPGHPDIVFPRYKVAMFVHGCFWHRHDGCRLASTPKTRTEFWSAKFERNVLRDTVARAALKNMGWRVETVWECETRSEMKVQDRLAAIFKPTPSLQSLQIADKLESDDGDIVNG